MDALSQAANSNDSDATGWLERLPGLLRGTGVMAILLSLYVFFVRGWEGSDDLTRFLMLFGHTIALAVIGLTAGSLLKEGKGARALMMLALVSVVANFSILGSFIYAEYGGALQSNFTPFMRWSLDSHSLTLLLAVLVPVVLSVVVLIGFRVLARGMSKRMSSLFLLSNLALLLPWRDPLLVSVLAVALAAYTLLLVMASHRQHLEAKTKEGRLSLLLQFVPLMVLLIRNIWLYDDATILYASLCMVAFIGLRQLALMMASATLFCSLIDAVSALLSLMIGALSVGLVARLVAVDAVVLTFSSMISAALLYELSTRARSLSRCYRNSAVIVLVLGVVLSMVFEDSTLSSLMSLLIGAALLYFSCMTKHRMMLLAALCLIAAGFISLTFNLWCAFEMNAWVVSAVVGVVAILAGSVLESKGAQLKAQLLQYQTKLNQWAP